MRYVMSFLLGALLLTQLHACETVNAEDTAEASENRIPSFIVIGKTYANATTRQFKVIELGTDGWIRVEGLTRGTNPGPWWVNTKRMTWVREVQ
jgi:hypothetical protein